MHRVSPHGKVPVPNNEDYNFDPNTYDREFFQEEGLEGRFGIDLIEAIKMEVDNYVLFILHLFLSTSCLSVHIVYSF